MKIASLVLRVCLGSVVAVGTVPRQAVVEACAPAPRSGEFVRIADEMALIVWDARSKTEHFVRRASFDTKASDFGFLVPTPTVPELGEVSPRLFGVLDELTRARVVHETRTEYRFGFGDLPLKAGFAPSRSLDSAMPAPAAAVQVVHEQKVAGFDATVLRADDPSALAGWLTEHGYESRPALVEWLRWYTEHQWIITAFKLSKDQPARDRFAAPLVRMSFHADRPFYPYREPEDMRGSGVPPTPRTLGLFVLSDQKSEATLGESESWPASTVWANSIPASVSRVSSELKLDRSAFPTDFTGLPYLTEFTDRSAPRPGIDEVYLRPASVPTNLERPPIVVTHVEIRQIPGEWGGVGLGVAIVAVPTFLISRRFRQGRRENVARA